MGMIDGWRGTYQDSSGRWHQRAPSEEEALIMDAVDETQDEIMLSAFDREPDENTGYDDEGFEQVEGWDGDPLSAAEQWHTAINGWDENNLDRPLQRAAENILTEDVRNIVQERDAYAQALNASVNGPEARAQRLADFRGNIEQRFNVLPVGDDGGQNLANAIQQSEEDRQNHSFRASHLEHGDRFADAFEQLQRSGDRGAVAQVMGARDPGGALMHWAYGQRGPRGGDSMPSLNSGQNNGSRSSPGRSRGRSVDLADQIGGWGDAETEDSIAASAWD